MTNPSCFSFGIGQSQVLSLSQKCYTAENTAASHLIAWSSLRVSYSPSRSAQGPPHLESHPSNQTSPPLFSSVRNLPRYLSTRRKCPASMASAPQRNGETLAARSSFSLPLSWFCRHIFRCPCQLDECFSGTVRHAHSWIPQASAWFISFLPTLLCSRPYLLIIPI